MEEKEKETEKEKKKLNWMRPASPVRQLSPHAFVLSYVPKVLNICQKTILAKFEFSPSPLSGCKSESYLQIIQGGTIAFYFTTR